MDMKLVILSVFLAFTGGQANPKVSLFPGFPAKRLYVGDEVTLRCKDGSNFLKNNVNWYKDGEQLRSGITNGSLYLPAVTKSDSGTYACESGGPKSNEEVIEVHNMVPFASLSVLNGASTVLGKGDAVLMKLFVKEGLNNWWCRYTEGQGEFWLPLLPEKLTNKNRSVIIHAEVGQEDHRTFWCMDTSKGLTREERPRSNAIKLTATEKMAVLHLSQRPARSGDTISLSCDVWGGAQVDQAVFYRNGNKITQINSKNPYVIPSVSKSDEGSYACNATYRFTHISTDAAKHEVRSDQQDLKVIDGPPKAQLDCDSLTCTCEQCKNPDFFILYHTPAGETHVDVLENNSAKKAGTYTCTAKLSSIGQSRHSNQCTTEGVPDPDVMSIVIVVLIVLLLLTVVVFGVVYKKRNSDQRSIRQRKMEEGADGGYEEVGKKEGEYELLKMSEQDKDKSQYETLKAQGKGKPEGEGKGEGKGEGGYEALKLGEAGGGVYHTLKEKGQGEGGYEALKLAEAGGGVYHTLKEQGEGEGGYQALKTAQAEVYHTLKDPAQAQGQGEYEALKTTQAQVYQTLGQKQESGPAEGQKTQEESPYEELKAEKKEKDAE